MNYGQLADYIELTKDSNCLLLTYIVIN